LQTTILGKTAEVGTGVDSLSDSQADGRRRTGCHEEELKTRGRPTLEHTVDIGGNITVELLISGSQVRSLRGPSRKVLARSRAFRISGVTITFALGVRG
jgi:hypothetical protein